MNISSKYPLRHAAGISFTFISGSKQMNHVVSFNGPAEMLRTHFQDRSFELPDVVNALMEEYEVSQADAEAGAKQWIDQMKNLGLIEN